MTHPRYRRARFYAFALNEFSYRRIHFTMHATHLAAEKSAYKLSGQRRRAQRAAFNGAASAHDDLEPTIIAGLEGFEKWAKECNYRIDWDERVLVYEDPRK